ncbi:alpha/beta hydrolase [Virgibacillus proomii]|uniref:alpha/beta hydrolase n=1 Tax=Virgibacillus proomii TaxID=84407 RepID=UPI000987B36D|nr:alpha/beta hydrolase [Virgibacillus proomii]
MKHIFQRGSDQSKPTFLLLHGTGGTERDLIPLATEIDAGANILSVRGNILENGMPRFFRRLAEGIFDEEDLVFRTEELLNFLNEAAVTYNFARDHIFAIGYSNGANIAASLLFHHQDALRGAILHHPMVPRRGIELPDLSKVDVFIAAGTNDPICPAQESEDLKQLLQDASANVHLHWENSGHQLTLREVQEAAKWYRQLN